MHVGNVTVGLNHLIGLLSPPSSRPITGAAAAALGDVIAIASARGHATGNAAAPPAVSAAPLVAAQLSQVRTPPLAEHGTAPPDSSKARSLKSEVRGYRLWSLRLCLTASINHMLTARGSKVMKTIKVDEPD